MLYHYAILPKDAPNPPFAYTHVLVLFYARSCVIVVKFNFVKFNFVLFAHTCVACIFPDMNSTCKRNNFVFDNMLDKHQDVMEIHYKCSPQSRWWGGRYVIVTLPQGLFIIFEWKSWRCCFYYNILYSVLTYLAKSGKTNGGGRLTGGLQHLFCCLLERNGVSRRAECHFPYSNGTYGVSY